MPAPRVAAVSDKRLRLRNRVRPATIPFLSCGGDGVTRFADDTAMLTRLLICLLAVDFLHSVCEQARTQNGRGTDLSFPSRCPAWLGRIWQEQWGANRACICSVHRYKPHEEHWRRTAGTACRCSGGRRVADAI